MKQRAKILVVTTTFPRWADDPVPARFVYDLCRQLNDRFDLTVLAAHDPQAELQEQLDGLDVRRFRYFWPVEKEFLCNGIGIMPNVRSSWLGKSQALTLMASQQAALRRLLAREHFDLIHSHWLAPSGVNVVEANRRRRAPHVVTIHSSDLHLLRRLPGGRRIVGRILRGTNRVVAVSSFLKRILAELVQHEVEADVLPMGVFTDRFRPRDESTAIPAKFNGKQIVLYVGKLIEVKGVEYLLRAFAQVLSQNPKVFLVLIGDGDRRRDLEQEAKRLKIARSVEFLGALPHSEIIPNYQMADLVVLPSIVTSRGETEGMPVVILEAFASGKPVVASRIGSIEDVIEDGKNGILVPPRDPGALADGILRLLREPNSQAWQKAAIKAVEPYDWRNIASHYANIYNDLLAFSHKS